MQVNAKLMFLILELDFGGYEKGAHKTHKCCVSLFRREQSETGFRHMEMGFGVEKTG